jgi:hypothetical protein
MFYRDILPLPYRINLSLSNTRLQGTAVEGKRLQGTAVEGKYYRGQKSREETSRYCSRGKERGSQQSRVEGKREKERWEN